MRANEGYSRCSGEAADKIFAGRFGEIPAFWGKRGERLLYRLRVLQRQSKENADQEGRQAMRLLREESS